MHSFNSYAGHATGAVRHRKDTRDYLMHRIPGVAQQATAGIPDAYDMSFEVKDIYVQGAIPCCTVASVAMMKSLHDVIDYGRWNMYEFLEAYHSLGGNDQEGVEPRSVLQYAQDTGLRIDGTTVRHRIGSYAFADQSSPALFISTLKAAISSNHPCVIACRLPQQFGWDSGGPATEAYHEMALVGYDPDDAIAANSWGRLWGNKGLARLPWAYLVADGFQKGDCRAYTAMDAIDTSLAPPIVFPSASSS